MTITRKSIMAGIKKSHERVERICMDCGEEFETSHNMEDTRRTCPACTLARRKEREEERREEERQRKSKRWDGTKHVMAQTYSIDFDPDESWGFNTTLSMMEVRTLLMDGNFSVGTRLRKDGKVYLVLRNTKKKAKTAQCLEEIE